MSLSVVPNFARSSVNCFSRFPLFVALHMIYHLNHMNKIEKVCGSAGNVLPPKSVDGHGSVCSWGEA
jgi:hypothetical protein